ncbi:uncharacterized protein PRCAT00004355001 [Priceomyces carsonii]|uniref:uncharacterized protein n=1 Tax=Priceomyces carsonii TaxID=28549 RepID=UPI002EDA2131|nr:unnamed protein product [Priceomyces carsonii]
MSVVTLNKESHSNPAKFRIKYNDAKEVLIDEIQKKKPSTDLPTLKSTSNVAIIGGGFAGLATAMTCLKDIKEEDFVIFERHDNFGGTWYANTYPGCASDIPAVWYSFFDELNSSWSELQPPQYEMEAYILKVVEKHKLRDHGRFQISINKSEYDDKNGTWKLTGVHVKTGQRIEHTCKVLVLCRGGLVHPRHLNSPGLDKFEGTYMHSAVWNHDVSFKGKDVVVVGNGCSANQVIPSLLESYEPNSITQIFRSKHYIMPPIPKIIYYFYKLLSFSRLGLIICSFLIAAVAESRFPLYKGESFGARAIRWINTKESTRYMKSKCPKQYQSMLMPDYKIGCKRLVFDKKYVPSLHDPRLHLSNELIDHIQKNYVVLKNGQRIKADIIVACTGYDLEKHIANDVVIGRNGTDVVNMWNKEGATAYETVLIKDCPNLFVIGGPNSASGHSSVVLAIENGCTFFGKVASKVLSGQYKSISVKPEIYYEWFRNTQAELKKSVFGTEFGGCVPWYSSKGVNSTAYPYSQITYWWRMSHPKWKDLQVEPNSKSN